jgi:hypothetical protein
MKEICKFFKSLFSFGKRKSNKATVVAPKDFPKHENAPEIIEDVWMGNPKMEQINDGSFNVNACKKEPCCGDGSCRINDVKLKKETLNKAPTKKAPTKKKSDAVVADIKKPTKKKVTKPKKDKE